MYNTKLGKFCAAHDNWMELLSAEPYNLKIKEDDGYVIFNYNQLSSDFTLDIIKEARGIIFKKNCWENPVCWAFNKFFNYGEPTAAAIDWSTAFVTEKIDGSIIKCWYDNNKWRVSTNGTINAFKAPLGFEGESSFGDYFRQALDKYPVTYLDKDYTYMFELIGPENRVVIPYDECDIYFLGARNKYTGKEVFVKDCSILGDVKFKCPKVYPLTDLESCIKVVEEYSWDQEGFVVCDAAGNRVKVKSPEYVKAHYSRTGGVITRKRLVKIILDNEVEEFLCYAADYKDRLEECKSLMFAFTNIGNELVFHYRILAGMLPRNEYAKLVKEEPSIYHGLLFKNYTEEVTAEDFTSNWDEHKWTDNIDKLEEVLNKLFRRDWNESL